MVPDGGTIRLKYYNLVAINKKIGQQKIATLNVEL
jgi:hypothetical protein